MFVGNGGAGVTTGWLSVCGTGGVGATTGRGCHQRDPGRSGAGMRVGLRGAALTLVGALVLTVGIGLMGTWRVLGQKAAPVLREL